MPTFSHFYLFLVFGTRFEDEEGIDGPQTIGNSVMHVRTVALKVAQFSKPTTTQIESDARKKKEMRRSSQDSSSSSLLLLPPSPIPSPTPFLRQSLTVSSIIRIKTASNMHQKTTKKAVRILLPEKPDDFFVKKIMPEKSQELKRVSSEKTSEKNVLPDANYHHLPPVGSTNEFLREVQQS